jgi:hypothetical protein
VISDAHGGIKAAIGQVLTGAGQVPNSLHGKLSPKQRGRWSLVRSIFEQPDRVSSPTLSRNCSLMSPK